MLYIVMYIEYVPLSTSPFHQCDLILSFVGHSFFRGNVLARDIQKLTSRKQEGSPVSSNEKRGVFVIVARGDNGRNMELDQMNNGGSWRKWRVFVVF